MFPTKVFVLYRYEEHLGEAKKSGIKKGAVNGFTMGLVWSLIYCAYALGVYLTFLIIVVLMESLLFFSIGFWYGAKLIRDEGYSIGNVIIVS